VYETVLYVTLAAGLLPCILFHSKQAKAKGDARPILPFLWLTAFASVYETLGSLILQWDTSYWFRIYDLLEFCAIFYFLHSLLGALWKKGYYLFPAIYGLLYIGCLCLWDDLNELQAKAIFSTILVIFICTGVFTWLTARLKGIKEILSTATPVLIFVLSILLYYTATYFLFLVSNELFTNAKENFENYWLLNIIATLLFRILLIVGVCLIK
jgi:hypothetical protein